MEESEQNSVSQEVAPQVQEVEVIQNTQEKPDQSAVDQEKNWREIRRKNKELERRLQEKDQMFEKVLNSMSTPKQQEVQEPEIDDSEFANAGLVKGLTKQAVKPLEKQLQELNHKLQQLEIQKNMNHLKSKYSDFDDVVNVETLEIFEEKEPQLAATLANIRDPYTLGEISYKLIKSSGLLDQTSNIKRTKEVEKKLEQNKKTVQSPAAFDKRPMAEAYKIADADRKSLYQEMMHFANGAPSAL